MPFHVAANPSTPFAQGFKQPMKLLSRKPVTRTVDPITGLERLTVEDDDDETDKKPRPTAAEAEEQRKRELEKKNRDYEERRAKLFGTPPRETTSGASTPGTTTPPLSGEGVSIGISSGGDRGGRGGHRGRDRGRGGRGGGRGGQRNGESYRGERNDGGTDLQDKRPAYNNGGRGGLRNESFRADRKDKNERDHTRNDSQERQLVNNSGSPYRELFDPDASAKPTSRQPRGSGTSSPTRGPEAAIRRPRGPENIGRGGFGFASRGSKGDGS